jgi:DNA-binding MarR family transcriptional regulator
MTEPAIEREVAQQVIAVAPRLGRLMEVLLERLPEPVSLLRYRILVRLAHEECRNSELAAHTWVSSPTMSSVVDSLVQCGWVERNSDPRDGRAAVLRLTTAGRRELKRAERGLETELTALLGKMDPIARAELGRGYASLLEVLDSEEQRILGPARKTKAKV